MSSALQANARMLVKRLMESWDWFVPGWKVPKSCEPIIIAHMKQLKMRPKGGRSVVPNAARADLMDGDQK